jgi:hypothetical protein
MRGSSRTADSERVTMFLPGELVSGFFLDEV